LENCCRPSLCCSGQRLCTQELECADCSHRRTDQERENKKRRLKGTEKKWKEQYPFELRRRCTAAPAPAPSSASTGSASAKSKRSQYVAVGTFKGSLLESGGARGDNLLGDGQAAAEAVRTGEIEGELGTDLVSTGTAGAGSAWSLSRGAKVMALALAPSVGDRSDESGGEDASELI
jgi:hypothetical protein